MVNFEALCGCARAVNLFCKLYFRKIIKNIIIIFFTDPKTRNSRSPRPLFGGQNSYIDDYFTGDIFAAFEEANNYENALIMFYSPWDTDCIRTVDLLETVAKTFIDNDVYFAAVNCWEPNGM